jgi:hypothetical protein
MGATYHTAFELQDRTVLSFRALNTLLKATFLGMDASNWFTHHWTINRVVKMITTAGTGNLKERNASDDRPIRMKVHPSVDNQNSFDIDIDRK